MKPLDLSQFKKIGRTRTHTIMEHPDGHVVHLKMAEGGEVPEAKPKDIKIPGSDEEKKKISKGFKGALGLADGTKKPIEAPIPSVAGEMQDSPAEGSLPAPVPNSPEFPSQEMIPRETPAPQVAPSADFTGKETEIPAKIKALEEEKAQTQLLGQEEAAGATKQADKIKAGMAVKNEFESKFQDELKSMQGELEQAAKDKENGYFHAKDIFNKGDTWGNIQTGIGLILGGIGGGILHTENPVMKMLTDKIDRDSEASGHLYKALEQKYGNRKDALIAERIYKYGILADELQRAGLQATSEKAKTETAINVSKLNQTIATNMGELAKSQVITSMVRDNGSLKPTASDKEGPVNYKELNRLELMSKLGVPNAPSKEDISKMTAEATNLEEARSLRKDLNHAFDELDKKALAGKLSSNQRDSYINSLAGKLAKVSAGRYNYQEAQNQINSMMPQASDNLYGLTKALGAEDTRKVRRENNKRFFDITEAGTPTLNRYEVKNKPQETEETKTMNGAQYKKVEGGWQKIK